MLTLITGIAFVATIVALPRGWGQIGPSSEFFVAPSGDDDNDCLSPATACRTIQSAIDRASDGSSIRIASGDYPEVLTIHQRKNLTLAGAPGAVIKHPGLTTNPATAVVMILLSTGVVLEDLTVAGIPETDGVRIHESSGIRVRRCTVEGTGGPGGAFFAFGTSNVQIEDSTVQDNLTGIRVDSNANVDLMSTPFSPGTSTIQRNRTGVTVRSGVFNLLGAGIVRENGMGIWGQGGTIKSCCHEGLRRINDNDVGIALTGDSLDLRGPLEMEGNRWYAIAQTGGIATISDRVRIRNNGRRESAAIAVTAGLLQLSGRQQDDVEILNNPGNGVTLSDNASAQIVNTVIRENGVHGVRAQFLSSVELLASAVLRDNAGLDLFCASNSFGHGDASGVRRRSCRGFGP